MVQVVVRNIENEVLEKLERRARKIHRSLVAELRLILTEAAESEAGMDGQHLAAVARVQELFSGHRFSDSTELLREDRER